MEEKIKRANGVQGKKPNDSRELRPRVAMIAEVVTRNCRDKGKECSSLKMTKT